MSPNMGCKYSYPTYNPIYNLQVSPPPGRPTVRSPDKSSIASTQAAAMPRSTSFRPGSSKFGSNFFKYGARFGVLLVNRSWLPR